jgi:hypothetical protein
MKSIPFTGKNSVAYPTKIPACICFIAGNIKNFSENIFKKICLNSLLQQAIETKEWMVKSIYDSRAKDYHSDFRKTVYDNKAEMEKVIGKLMKMFLSTSKKLN